MSRIPPLPIYPKIKKLYEDSKVISGSIQLNDSITNYDIIAIRYKSNAEYSYRFILDPQIANYVFEWAQANAAGLQTEPFYYKNSLAFSITSDTTKVSVDATYNNGNLQVGVVAIYGIKIVDSIE